MPSWIHSILQPVSRPIRGIIQWGGFRWTVGTLALLTIGAFALWFYLENQLLDQESLSTTIFNLILMESGVILGLVAVVLIPFRFDYAVNATTQFSYPSFRP